MKKILILCSILAIVLTACTQTNTSNTPMEQTHYKHTNALVNESSPYLLQHAHNPVDWYPWGDEALEKAKKENKMLLISVGYSACHWCHVMEKESFEDSLVAKLMNDNFICIKVDREERPDVDQIYMNAVQLMTGSGGWPLNCIALPDGRPVWGGTYFPKDKWMESINFIADYRKNNPEKLLEYAEKLTEGIKTSELILPNQEEAKFNANDIDELYVNWSKSFDNKKGGPDRAPKFPIPNNYEFLLRYAHQTNNSDALQHVKLTLDEMSYGGIYDQIGGGMARYSTDSDWKVPHFEKMLYDNAQLVSLYSMAYQKFDDENYKRLVYQTLDFVSRELMNDEGAFYSALDADSEGEEGKFYIWKQEELEQAFGSDYKLMASYYNVNRKGFWEHDNYILLRDESDESFASDNDISVDELYTIIDRNRKKLMAIRDERVRPGLDDKSLTSWNAMMLKGFVDAYQSFGEKRFLNAALKNADFIVSQQMRSDGGLYHSYKNGKSSINGYLEDYAFVIEAFLSLYEASFDEQWLQKADRLAQYCYQHFHNKENQMFFFTSDEDQALVARKMEVTDNVIPASNSSLAKSLFLLSHHLDNKTYYTTATEMLNNVKPHMSSYGSGYSNWASLMMNEVYPFYEVAITGPEAKQKLQELNENYIPNKLLSCSTKESQLPLLENRYDEAITRYFVCVNKVCQLPTEDLNTALKYIK